jgi:hypothetical protein
LGCCHYPRHRLRRLLKSSQLQPQDCRSFPAMQSLATRLSG